MIDLSAIMEFDHPVQVLPDGSVADASGMYAPTLLDDLLDSPDWELWSDGYTNQCGYNGPIMHNSEFIGGRLARDILETPGVYVSVVAYWVDPEDGGRLEAEGWAIARLVQS